jgi:hypothetical protein
LLHLTAAGLLGTTVASSVTVVIKQSEIRAQGRKLIG